MLYIFGAQRCKGTVKGNGQQHADQGKARGDLLLIWEGYTSRNTTWRS